MYMYLHVVLEGLLEDRNMTTEMATWGPQRSTADECSLMYSYLHVVLEGAHRGAVSERTLHGGGKLALQVSVPLLL